MPFITTARQRLIEEDDDILEFDELHMPPLNHQGKRADKVRVGVDAMNNEWEVDEYTMTCPECEGDGRYDSRGDVICEDCGVVLGGAFSMRMVVPGEARKERAENTKVYR